MSLHWEKSRLGNSYYLLAGKNEIGYISYMENNSDYLVAFNLLRNSTIIGYCPTEEKAKERLIQRYYQWIQDCEEE